MRSLLRPILCGVALMSAVPCPASQKPCRDQEGKVVTCKAVKKDAAPRCKDEKGRFAACTTPTTNKK